MKIMDIGTSLAIGLTGIITAILGIIQLVITKSNNNKELRIRQDIEKVTYLTIKDENDVNRKQNIKEDYLYRLLELYYNQALQQANIQFWFSIVAAVLGFIFIFIIIFIGNDKAWYEYILRSMPGAIVETVSVLFINQSKETRERATNFFKELNYDKKIERSVEIANTIENSDTKSDIKSKIALHIIGIDDVKQK